jgi:hypothetical protein
MCWATPLSECLAVARPENDVAVWIGNAFIPGLEHAGFHIERAEHRADAPTPIALRITVTEAYVHSEETRVAVVVDAARNGQSLFRRTYSGVSTLAGGSSADAYQRALQDALQKMLDQAIPNLAAALARELG